MFSRSKYTTIELYNIKTIIFFDSFILINENVFQEKEFHEISKPSTYIVFFPLIFNYTRSLYNIILTGIYNIADSFPTYDNRSGLGMCVIIYGF